MVQRLVVIVGVGALGSHVAQFLRNEQALLRLVDHDRIERKNVLSQFHGKPSVGKLKVHGLQSTMQFLYGLATTAIPHRLTGDNAKELLGDADLVIDCLDNGAARRIVQGFVRSAGIPCLHGALAAAGGGFGRVVWDDIFTIDDEAGQGAATCEGGGELPFIAVVSAVVARAAQDFLLRGERSSYHAHGSSVVKFA